VPSATKSPALGEGLAFRGTQLHPPGPVGDLLDPVTEPDEASRSKAVAKGAKLDPLPAFIEPCLATLVLDVPKGERWLHEIKWDGYRLMLRVGRSRLGSLPNSADYSLVMNH